MERTRRNLKCWDAFTIVLVMPAFFLSVNAPHVLSTTSGAVNMNTKTAYSKYVVDTPSCHIESFNIMDSVVKRYYRKMSPVNCEIKKPLTFIRDGQLWINSEARSLYGKDELSCCYSYIYRRMQSWARFDKNADSIIRYGACQAFQAPVNLTQDFVHVECRASNKTVYKNTHAFISRPRFPKPVSQSQDHPSILIIGLDSLSRLNFHRQMPMTIQLLERFGFTEYLGYNKMADNTFPNLAAVLTGRTTTELRELCWKRNVYPMDECPFIWKNFNSLNYKTFYGEDMPTFSTFTYNKLGFLFQPTDFYYRPYSLAVRNLAKRESNMCYGYQHSVQHLLDYTLDFAVTHRNVPFFALSWEVRLTHSDFNEPQLADPLYHDFLEKLNATGALRDPIVIFMSDHGLRFGQFRQTYQGYVEERLPAFWAKFPDWLVHKFPKAMSNFRANARKLTSPFDLHQTLLDLLNLSRLAEPLPPCLNTLRGQSLFTEINPQRTCSEAGIDETWCTCHSQVAVPASDPAVQGAARFVVRELNELLAGRKECAELSLSRVLEARRKSDNLTHAAAQVERQYIIRLETKPGDADLETMVEHSIKENTFVLTSFVSRLNTYWNQSQCMTDPVLKLYCYCKVQSH